MSATLKITVTCDGCNRLIGEAESSATASGFASAQTEIWFLFRKKKHMDSRTAWRKTRHYCRECADGVPASETQAISQLRK